MDVSDLLQNFEANAPTPEDWQRVETELRNHSLEVRDASVTVGGSVTASIIVAGSNNTVTVQGVNAERLLDLNNQILSELRKNSLGIEKIGAQIEEAAVTTSHLGATMSDASTGITRTQRIVALILILTIVGLVPVLLQLAQILLKPAPVLPQGEVKLVQFANQDEVGGVPDITALAQQGDSLLMGIRTSDGGHRLCQWTQRTAPLPTLECKLNPADLPSYAQAQKAKDSGETGLIKDIDLDCHGNVWLTIENIGAVVYREPIISSLIFNQAAAASFTPPLTLTYNGLRGLAVDPVESVDTFCTPETPVRVWMGNRLLYAYELTGDYPEIGVNFKPVTQHAIDLSNENLRGIQGVTYEAASDTIWFFAIDEEKGKGVIVAVPLSVGQSQRIVVADYITQLSLNNNIPYYNVGKTITFTDSNGITAPPQPVTSGVRAIAIAPKWLWVGGRCSKDIDDCQPLTAFTLDLTAKTSVGLPNNFNGSPRLDVTALLVDSQNHTWIGTSSGLLSYIDQ